MADSSLHQRMTFSRKPTMSTWYLRLLATPLRLVRFLVFAFGSIIIYLSLLDTIFTRKIHIVAYLLFWLFTAYVILPRINRRLAKLYVPDYYIGRALTADGMLGDPINLALYGNEKDVIKAMKQAGWSQAAPITLSSSLRIIGASILGRSYPEAPISPLFLFGRQQSLAFQQEVHNSPRRRHHVRFWKTPEGWRMPGGARADWLGAATYDRNVGLSLFTGQITHKISADVDRERDFVLQSLISSRMVRKVHTVKYATSSYQSRNGGGDKIYTDGSLPFVTIG